MLYNGFLTDTTAQESSADTATATPTAASTTATTPAASTTANSTGGFQISGTVLKGYSGTSTGVIIPNSVTKIGGLLFTDCTSLSKVTFQGPHITFAPSPFPGDLDQKYLAGGIGTYTTANPGYTAVWTKQ
jgi:hypothetical protein